MILVYKDKSIRNLQIAKLLIFGFVLTLMFGFLTAILKLSTWFLLILLLVPLVLLFREGIEIDTIERRYRRYKQFVKKEGEWKNLDKFSLIVLKPISGKKHIYHVHTMALQEYSNYKHDVYLMDAKQGGRLHIRTFKKKKKATLFANKLSKQINMDVSDFIIKSRPKSLYRRR